MIFKKKIVFLIAFFFIASAIIYPLTQSEKITQYMKNSQWEQADRELADYIASNPDKDWAYSSHEWVLENLKRYDEAIDIAERGLKKWPDNSKLQNALTRALAAKAETLPPKQAHSLLLRASSLVSKDYIDHRLAKSFREMGDYPEAIRRMESGVKKYPNYPYFSDSLPYTRFLYFKQIKETKDKTKIRNLIAQSLDWLDPQKPLTEQIYYVYIIRFGLRELDDPDYLHQTYATLIKKFKNDPYAYDEYGFQIYASYRLYHDFDPKVKEQAISYRKKAYTIYWQQHQLPSPIRNMDYPMKGAYAVWASFGGSAMTHNGFAHYCYDFAAVNEQGEIFKPGTEGKHLKDYYMWGLPVYSVAAGKVSSVVNGYPDNQPGNYSDAANTVTIDHGNYRSFYAHMKQNGIIVEEGEAVKSGQLIGYIGNSGMSVEPHLHYCVYSSDDPEITIPYLFKKTKVKKSSGETILTEDPYEEKDIVYFE